MFWRGGGVLSKFLLDKSSFSAPPPDNYCTVAYYIFLNASIVYGSALYLTAKKFTKNSYTCSNLARLQVSYDDATSRKNEKRESKCSLPYSPRDERRAPLKTPVHGRLVKMGKSSACNAGPGDAQVMLRHACLSTNNPMTHCECSNGECLSYTNSNFCCRIPIVL